MKEIDKLIKLIFDRAYLSFPELMAEIEKRCIRMALSKFNWNVSMAALYLGLNRTTLHMKMNKYGIFREHP